MSGYTRQQSYIDGDVILAEHTNDEFDLLAEVFDTTLGHKHDGTVAEGPTIDLISDDDGDTKIQVEEGADDDTIRFDTLGVERLTIGSTGDITAIGNAIFNGTVDMNSTITVDGATTFSTRPSFNGGTSGVDSPFTVDSTFKVTNLNADLLDGRTTQTNNYDTNTNAVMSVGGFGLGAAVNSLGVFDADNLTLGSFSGVDGLDSDAALNNWPTISSPATAVWWNIRTIGASTRTTQIATQAFSGGTRENRIFIRNKHDTSWTPWAEVWTSDFQGASSGLDADLLDGQHGSYYAALSEAETITGVWDHNASLRLANNIYLQGRATGGSYFNMVGMNASNQIVVGESTRALALLGGSVTFEGNTVWHSGNDGASSGLDADLLDGIQGSSYARTDAPNTITGSTKITGNPLVLGPVGSEGGQINLNTVSDTTGWILDLDPTDTCRLFTTSVPNTNLKIGQLAAGTGIITLNTNNNERTRITSTGDFLIGTTTVPAYTSLTDLVVGSSVGSHGFVLQGSATGQSVIAFGDTQLEGRILYDYTSNFISITNNNNTERLRIISNGDTGIGTTSPVTRLHVESSAGSVATIGGTTDNARTVLGWWTAGDTDIDSLLPGSSFGNLIQGATNGHFVLALRDNDSADSLSIISGGGNYLTDTTYDTLVASFRADGTVGIGTASPSQKLHVLDSGTVGFTLTSTSGDSNIRVIASNTGTSRLYLGDSDLESSGYVEYQHTAESLELKGTSRMRFIVGSERARIDSGGNFLIGTTDTTISTATTGEGIVYVNGGAFSIARNDGNAILITNQTSYVSGTVVHANFRENGVDRGSITTNGSTTSFNTTSDYRLKENVVDLTDATSRLKELPVHRFNFIGREETLDGFLAHEVQAVVPEAVTGEKDGEETDGTPIMQQMDASKLVPLLTAALKETTEKLENVVGRLAELEVRIQELEGK